MNARRLNRFDVKCGAGCLLGIVTRTQDRPFEVVLADHRCKDHPALHWQIIRSGSEAVSIAPEITDEYAPEFADELEGAPE